MPDIFNNPPAAKQTFKVHADAVTYPNDWVFTFGQYKGHTIDDVAADNPSYICWCTDEVAGFRLRDEALIRECRRAVVDINDDIDDDAWHDAPWGW